MKVLILASVLIYSTVSFASYKCNEKDSQIVIDNKDLQAVKVSLTEAQGTQTFTGVKTGSDTSAYYEIQSYALVDAKGQSVSLKVNLKPIYPPCHSRRFCKGMIDSWDFSADLDYQGKVTHYICNEDNT